MKHPPQVSDAVALASRRSRYRHPSWFGSIIGAAFLIVAGGLTLTGAVDSRETPLRPKESASTTPAASDPLVEISARFIEIPESSLATEIKPGHLLYEITRQITESSISSIHILSTEETNSIFSQLTKTRGADTLLLPQAKVRSGQAVTVEDVKEFKYPTEYDPPEKRGTKVPTPIAFDVKPIGPSLEAKATIAPGEETLQMAVTAKVVDLAGVIHYSKEGAIPLIAKSRGLAHTMDAIAEVAKFYKKAQEGVCQPVFPMLKIQTSVNLWSGQTVVLEGIKPAPEDELLKKKSERHFIFVFITTQIVGGTQKALSQAAQ